MCELQAKNQEKSKKCKKNEDFLPSIEAVSGPVFQKMPFFVKK